MAKQLEARVIVERQTNGKNKVFYYCPYKGEAIPTGITAWPGDDTDKEVRKLKEMMEKKGHRVTVKVIL